MSVVAYVGAITERCSMFGPGTKKYQGRPVSCDQVPNELKQHPKETYSLQRNSVVSFATETGEWINAPANLGVLNAYMARAGDRIEILYNPNNPTEVLGHTSWLIRGWFGVLSLVGISFIGLARWFGRADPNARATAIDPRTLTARTSVFRSRRS